MALRRDPQSSHQLGCERLEQRPDRLPLVALAPATRWRLARRGGRRTRHGHAGVEHYFRVLAEQREMVEFRTDEFIAEGDRVVMVRHCAWRFRATGRVAKSPLAHVWRFRDGLAVDSQELYGIVRAFAAAVPS